MHSNTTDALPIGRIRLQVKRVCRPLRQALATGNGQRITVRESILLRVETDTGTTGYGEAAPLPWFGTEDADTAYHLLRQAATELNAAAATTATPLTSARIAAALAAIPQHATCARWALECAFTQAGLLPALPMPSALSAPSALPACNSTNTATPRSESATATTHSDILPIAALPPPPSQPILTPSPLGELLEAGFRAMKLKIGVQPFEQESEYIQALATQLLEHNRRHAAARQANPATTGRQTKPATTGRQTKPATTGTQTGHSMQATTPGKQAGHSARTAVPGTQAGHGMRTATPAAQTNHSIQSATIARLRLDANGSLTPQTLRDWLRLLEPLADAIDFIEQPLPAGQEAACAAMFAHTALAFALDESLTSLPQLVRIAQQCPQAVLVVKPSLLGSAAGFIQWRNQPQNRQRRIVYSTALETGIGLHHALRLAATDPQQPLEPAGFGTGNLFADDGLGCPPRDPLIRLADGGFATTSNNITPTSDDAEPLCAQPGTLLPAVAHSTGANDSPADGIRASMEAIWKRA